MCEREGRGADAPANEEGRRSWDEVDPPWLDAIEMRACWRYAADSSMVGDGSRAAEMPLGERNGAVSTLAGAAVEAMERRRTALRGDVVAGALATAVTVESVSTTAGCPAAARRSAKTARLVPGTVPSSSRAPACLTASLAAADRVTVGMGDLRAARAAAPWPWGAGRRQGNREVG